MTISYLNLSTGFLLRPRTFYICHDVTTLRSHIGWANGNTKSPSWCIQSQLQYIDLANVIALPATTFTFQMPHWHGTVHGERNRDDKPGSQFCSHAALCTDGETLKTIHENNTAEENHLESKRRNRRFIHTLVWIMSIYWYPSYATTRQKILVLGKFVVLIMLKC